MWLINTRTLTLKEFLGLRPEYAILSHTWGKDEVLFQDMINGSFRNKLGFQKVEMTCKIALQLGHKWAWIDSCCIDKSSSAELSEAINSMYRWYEHSEICFAYLGDLPATTAWENIEQKLTPCRWFKRGWTLQELIAPGNLYFFDQEWNERGSKERRAESLSVITGISKKVLLDTECLSEFSVAQKMSWAAGRSTTRTEDTAYCLLGIFDVHMPLLYGEDRKAFRRLQEEIIRSIPDMSIFAWKIPPPMQILDPRGNRRAASPMIVYSILARSPNAFESCAHFTKAQNPVRREFSISNIGVKTQARILMSQIPGTPLFRYLLPLGCSLGPQRLLAVSMKKCGPNHFIRDDPWNLAEYTGYVRPYNPIENYLLTELPLTNLDAHSDFLPIRELITYTRPHILQISTSDDTFVSDAWPMSRFDHENQLYFSFSDFGGDSCALRLMIHPILALPGSNKISVSFEILLYAIGWATSKEPQCSLLNYRENSTQLLEFQSQIAGWDQDTSQVILHLRYNKVLKFRQVVFPILETHFSLVVNYKLVYMEDFTLCQNGFWKVEFEWEVVETTKCPAMIRGIWVPDLA